MHATMRSVCFCFIVAIACMFSPTNLSKVHSELNPGCEQQLGEAQCRPPRLLYLRSTVNASAGTTLHVLFSLFDVPACLLLLSEGSPGSGDVHSTPLVNWTRLLNSSDDGYHVISAANVTAAYGLSIDQLVEFDDPADTGNISSSASEREMSLVRSPDSAGLVVDESSAFVNWLFLNKSGMGSAGHVDIAYNYSTLLGRSEELPRLQFTSLSTLLTVTLSQLITNSGYKHSRFGLFVSSVSRFEQHLHVDRHIDDEYSPSVFQLYSMRASPHSSQTGYMQWKPVTYTSNSTDGDSSTTATLHNISSSPSSSSPSSSSSSSSRHRHAVVQCRSRLLHGYFDRPVLTARVGNDTTPRQYHLLLTFGTPHDGWYNSTGYNRWCVSAGVGVVPSQRLSWTVLMMLILVLSVPGVMVVGSCGWLLVRRVRAGCGVSVDAADSSQRAVLVEHEH